MHDVCFCGHESVVETRTPVRDISGTWTLCCPRCNRLDDLAWMPERARAAVWRDVWARRLRARASGRVELAEVR